jgi:hypothetical protein
MAYSTAIAYEGRITRDRECRVDRLYEDGSSSPLDPRLDLANKSPTGFAWGYNGSGPAQLAIAILADHLRNDESALRFFQDFKCTVIGRLDQDAGWRLTRTAVSAAMARIEAERAMTDTTGG